MFGRAKRRAAGGEGAAPTGRPRVRGSRGGLGYVALRTSGELLVTAGIIVLLFVFYALYVTSWTSAQRQAEANTSLEQGWSADRETGMGIVEGEAFARIYIPSFGTDYRYTIQSGVGAGELEIGPGHYPHTALPGDPGNFAVAGHRVGHGAPFNELDELTACDAIVIETEADYFVYRVMPFEGEADDWAEVRRERPACGNVSTLRAEDEPDGGPYGDTAGQRIVSPARSEVLNPVPYRPADTLQRIEQASLITLTTPHPEFSNRERLIIHGVLTQQIPKDQVPGDVEQVLEQIGAA